MARALQTAALSFGLVNIPVKVYTAASSKAVSFHLLHNKDGSRVHQQLVCNSEGRVVPRRQLVKGFEVSKGRHVAITEQELKSLEAEANRNIEILEFVSMDSVDPVYFEKSYYLGPDRGAEKSYRLLADAMLEKHRGGIAQMIMRGKEQVVLIRPSEHGHLVMSALYYRDEVREISEVEILKTKATARELRLAANLVDQLSADRWQPEKYRDRYRQRVLELIRRKEKGQKVEPQPGRGAAPVVDLMSALKRSLEQTPRPKPGRSRGGRKHQAA
jgi:DNA end-binding protein Ku